MKLSKKQIARKVNELAALKAKISLLEVQEHSIVVVLKKAGGGESKTWRAAIVDIGAHTKHIPAHEQLRLFPQ